MTKPYCIGSDEWNGLSKLIEEMGELHQVCGKLIGSEGKSDHWSGKLRDKFIEEIGDVYASLNFFTMRNFTSEERELIIKQMQTKEEKFKKWDKEVRSGQDSL